MTVPFEITSVTFEAEPAEGATWRVNRKNLGAGGSNTDFLITVTAEDGTKQVYTVTVHRSEKSTAAASSGSGSSGSGSTTKPSTSGSSSSTAASTSKPAATATPTPAPSPSPGRPAGAVEVEVESDADDPGGDQEGEQTLAPIDSMPTDLNDSHTSAPIVLRGGETSLLPVLVVVLVLLLAAFFSAPIAKWLGKKWEKNREKSKK